MPMLFSLWGLYRIAVLGAAALHYWLNSDPCCLAGRKPTAAGATFWRCSRDRGFGWKRLGLPLGKEPTTKMCAFSSAPASKHSDSGFFVYAAIALGAKS